MGQTESKRENLQQQSAKEPKKLLEEAEAHDGYLEAIEKNDINRRARETFVYAPYKGSIFNINQNDNQFPQGIIITMMPSAEAGFPHTRGKNIICIPAYYPQERLPSLVIHERIHLDQKAHRIQYDNFYKTHWGFKENTYKIPENILNLVRINPDTIGWPTYIWRDTWIPICLFQREDKPNMRECSYCWYNPRGGVLLKSMPPAWRDFFGDVGQSEHPNELSACYGADYEHFQNNEAAKLFYSFLFARKSSVRE